MPRDLPAQPVFQGVTKEYVSVGKVSLQLGEGTERKDSEGVSPAAPIPGALCEEAGWGLRVLQVPIPPMRVSGETPDRAMGHTGRHHPLEYHP